MFKFLEKLNPFKEPQAAEYASRKQHQYRHLLIIAQEEAAYQMKMVDYYRQGIARLDAHIPTEIGKTPIKIDIKA